MKTVEFTKLRVLVVENHALMRRILRETLRGFGTQQIDEARDVPRAIDLVYRETYDVIILDFFLGDLDGADFTRLVRHDAACRNRRIPILLITAQPDHDKVVKGLQAGIDGMLAKPISPKDLYLRLHALLTRPRTFVICDGYVGPSRRPREAATKTLRSKGPSALALRAMRGTERPELLDQPGSEVGPKGMDEILFV